MMPSSVNVGVRPSIASRRSYSCFVSPCSAISAAVMAGSPGRGVTAVTSGRHSGEYRLEQSHPIAGAKQLAARSLRMWHHAEHVAAFVGDAGDVALGTIRVGV